MIKIFSLDTGTFGILTFIIILPELILSCMACILQGMFLAIVVLPNNPSKNFEIEGMERSQIQPKLSWNCNESHLSFVKL